MSTPSFDKTLFDAWQTRSGLLALDARFQSFLQTSAPVCLATLQAMRDDGIQVTGQPLMDMAQALEDFLASLFAIEADVLAALAQQKSHHPIILFKKHYVLKEGRRRLRTKDSLPDFTELNAWLDACLGEVDDDKELRVAQLAVQWLQDPKAHRRAIERLIAWCAYGLFDPRAQQQVCHWVSFQLPQMIKPDQLVHSTYVKGGHQAQADRYQVRTGFGLLDQGMSERAIVDQVHYCVYCHDKSTDFCRSGFPEKPKAENTPFKQNAMGNVLTGCPLDQKISEMHALKAHGHVIAPLAVVMVDNPMCPATGHRICNDCMKSCIYQKQQPVNTPEVESAILRDALHLPWGVEIYDLLTRWNPLRAEQYLPKPMTQHRVLVMGMGPAGFTLMHHLAMEGVTVVGMDGMTLAPTPSAWLHPMQDATPLLAGSYQSSGFGGVAEYGITARWDKRYLNLLRLTLARRAHVTMLGSIRLGGTLSVDDIWRLGFDHLALCTGAGLPKELAIPNAQAFGMRSASDFLMALHLSDATSERAQSVLEVSLPALVIGGGLTAVDAATEVQAYYLQQIECVLARVEALDQSEAEFLATLPEEARRRTVQWLAHARTLRTAKVAAGDDVFDPMPLLQAWGGVHVVYRKQLQDSPAYRINHEELQHALDQGIQWLEQATPLRVEVDAMGHVQGLLVEHQGQNRVLPAATILVATGLRLNVAYEFEHRGTLERAESFAYQTYDDAGVPDQHQSERHCKEALSPWSGYPGHKVSLLGDLHPMFQGSVVKAMASAKRIYPAIARQLAESKACHAPDDMLVWQRQLLAQLQSKVVAIEAWGGGWNKLIVHAPQMAQSSQMGHLFRVQSEALVPIAIDADGGRLTFAWHPQHHPRLLSLKVGMSLSVLGPSGIAFKASDAVHLCITDATWWPLAWAKQQFLLQRGVAVGVLLHADLHEGAALSALFKGPVHVSSDVEDLSAWLKQWTLGPIEGVSLYADPHWLAVYRDTAVPWLPKHTAWQVAVMGPFQCLLKGVCAQCWQWQVDPATGQRTKAVYSCSWPYQSFDTIDLTHLTQRRYLGVVDRALQVAQRV